MRFELLEPASLDEALEILRQTDGEIKILAGGTDLLMRIKRGVISPAKVMSLSRIAEMDTLYYRKGQGLFIGALVTHAKVAENSFVKEKFSALADACSVVGSPQIRNLGTVVGNIANASPAADTAPALLALGAKLIIRDTKEARLVPLTEFFLGPMKTTLMANKIIEGIIIPEQPSETYSTYIKLGRRKALEISICSVSLSASLQGGKWTNVRLALGAVAPVPLLEIKSSNVLNNKAWTEEIIKEAGRIAANNASPIDDQRSSAAYRRSMIEVLVARCARELSAKALGGAAND